MSVERMKYVNIVGPIHGYDEFVLNYIINKDIQLEHSLNFPEAFKGLKPFIEENQYEPLIKMLNNTNRFMKVQSMLYSHSEFCNFIKKPIDIEKTMTYAKHIEENFIEIEKEIEKRKAKIAENQQVLRQLTPIKNFEFDMQELFNLEYIKIRFGKMPKANFNKLDLVLEGLNVIVIPFSNDDKDVWISYFMPAVVSERIDNVLSSLYFERVRIPGKVKGYPQDAITVIEQEIKQLNEEIIQLKNDYEKVIRDKKEEFQQIYNKAIYFHKASNTRKYAAHTKETFLLAGWITEKSYQDLLEELKGRKDIVIAVEEPDEVRGLKPPTILRNNKFFRPFESIVKMYGIPAHNEIDPTALIAVTYILMFGAMFGDIGQGAILTLAGIFMYIKRKMAFGWVLGCVGISSVVFGFLYGSIFGNEHIISPLWKAPMDNINQLLILAIGFGAIMIVVAIGINIINSIKAKDYGRLFFDKNGLAGLVFYGGALCIVLIALTTGNIFLSFPVVFIVVIMPLLAMLFKDPLEKILNGNSEKPNGSFVEGFFEVFEAVLGFLSNTISFVRVAAFALSHAGLALAIWTLYDMVNGAGGIVVLIIGNILIIGLEGLIVGIQGLRLQYYELFSRFFSGNGREFKTVRIREKSKIG